MGRKRSYPLHNAALKEVQRNKNEARKELRTARKQGFSSDAIQAITMRFFSLVRSHSHLKKLSHDTSTSRNIKEARKQCHQNLCKFAKDVLDGNESSHITPAFDKDTHKFFAEVYHAVPRNYVQPAWMPTPKFPEVEMDCSPFTPEEVVKVIKKTNHSSAPSPFDRVGYTIFKKCPALIPALLDLFNACWSQAFIPAQWKTAAVKLIAKGSAEDDPGNPGNFRPIALTPCISKIFITLLRNCWLMYMIVNGYLDSSLPSCLQSLAVLSTISSPPPSWLMLKRGTRPWLSAALIWQTLMVVFTTP